MGAYKDYPHCSLIYLDLISLTAVFSVVAQRPSLLVGKSVVCLLTMRSIYLAVASYLSVYQSS